MQKKLQHRLEKKNLLFFYLPLLLAVTPSVCLGQSVLEPGDLLIMSISSGSAVNFEFMPLVNLEKGTVIHFTDNAYVSETGSLTQTESKLTYTAPETVAAGTVISYNEAEQNFDGPEPEPGGLGNNLLVYQIAGLDITFIYGIEWGNNSPSWTYSTTAAGSYSDVPPGLSKDAHTVVSLGEGQYHWYNTVNGTEGSPEALVRLVGNPQNWHSGGAMPSEYDTSFLVLHAPVLRLSVPDVSVSTAEGRIRVSVELVESAREPVSAQVIFLEDSSTVSKEDIEYFSTQTVRFSGSDDKGSAKTITISVSDSMSFTDSRTAVFSLQNSTAGSIATPRIIAVEIEAEAGGVRASKAPDLTITEINADPYDDADGNGVTDRSDDEFVEFANNRDTDIDISGWTFSDDGSTIRHVFPAGTVIPASGALVLFANEEIIPAGSFGGAIVQNSNQSETLHLDDQGDVPTLRDAGGHVIARYPYGTGAGDNQLTSDVSAGDHRFKKHSDAAGYERTPSSPGVQTDGSSYGPAHRMGIRDRGWRVIASPEQNISFKDLLSGFSIQGIGGSDAPAEEATIYHWDEASGGTLIKPASVTDIMESGRGYMVYFSEDNRTRATRSREEIPNAITVDKTSAGHPVSVTVSATDANENGVIDQNEGYNLLGNPFGTNISVTAVLDALEKIDNSLNRNVLVWSPASGNGNGAYRSLTDGDFIAPFQAFFIRFMDEVSGNAVLNHADLLPGKIEKSLKEDREEPFGYNITLSDGSVSDTYQLIFRGEGDTGPDKLDAYKLFSLNPGSLNLFSREGTIRLMKNILPIDLNTTLEIPLLFESSEGKEAFELTWEGIGRMPEDWDIRLVDQELDKEIDLRNSSGYDFSAVLQEATRKSMSSGNTKSLISQPETDDREPRFVLLISPGLGLPNGQDELSEAAKLNPNYPNPFNSTTRIPFELSEEAEVELSIWNIVGQKVATLIDEVREAGPDEVVWNAADLPSGIYIAQMEVGGNVYIRKMTLIKY